MGIQIYKNLVRLNCLPAEEAESIFLDCCGSHVWARRMTVARPFRMIEELYFTADKIWRSLADSDRIEAYSERIKLPLEDDSQDTLLNAARLYHDKFGFIFVVDSTGRSAEELLAICKARLGNSAETELAIASNEHRKIIESRLNELLEK